MSTLLDLGDVYDANAGNELYVYDDDGDLATATVVLTITLPDGTTTTPPVSEVSTGRFQASYKPTIAGTHYVRWVATSIGGVSGEDSAEETSFAVSVSNNTYINLTEAKDFLNLQSTTHDEEVLSYIEKACDLAQEIADTQFARLAVVDILSPRRGDVSLTLTKRPVLSVTSVTENGTTLTTGTGYATDLRWGRLFRQYGQYIDTYWWTGRRNVVVTYVAGYQVVPTPVVFATLQILEHLWSNQRAGSPLAGPAPFDDSPHSIRASQAGHTWNVPNKARDVLMDYRPPGVA